MHILNNINWLAVMVGAIGYFMLGAVWYSFLFDKAMALASPLSISASR